MRRARPVKTSACATASTSEFAARSRLGALVSIRVGNGLQDALEAGAAELIFGREIGAAEKRSAIGKQETGERPAALSGNAR